MKLVLKREPFLAALHAASSIVPLRSVKPILKNALLIAQSEEVLEIQATDMEVGLRYRIKAESIKNPASLLIPCSTLAGLLRECTEEVVTIETEGSKCTLKVGRDVFEILGQESSEFPDVSDLGETAPIAIPSADLGEMIDRTIFATAKEPARYAINGVFVQFKEKLLELVSTDGKRLAYCKRKIKADGELEEGVIVPIKMMQEVKKLCEQMPADGELKMVIRGRNIIVNGGEMTLSSVLVEGIFPKYQQVIPRDCSNHATLKRDLTIQALRKAAFLTSEDTRTVTMKLSAGTCQIEARSPDKGNASVTVEIEYEGDPVEIQFNPQYIQDGLKVIKSEAVRMELKDSSRPGLIREGTDFIYVIMPVSSRGDNA